jgi:hypothetical protein
MYELERRSSSYIPQCIRCFSNAPFRDNGGQQHGGNGNGILAVENYSAFQALKTGLFL